MITCTCINMKFSASILLIDMANIVQQVIKIRAKYTYAYEFDFETED